MESGRIEIFRRRADGSTELLAHIGAGNYFGEIGPMLNLPRSASARAEQDSDLVAVTVRDFRRQFPQHDSIHPSAEDSGPIAPTS